jgi:hypothetical protein
LIEAISLNDVSLGPGTKARCNEAMKAFADGSMRR